MLAGTLLLQHRKNVDREQRKAEAIAALERVPHCNTDTCSYAPHLPQHRFLRQRQHRFWNGLMFLTRRIIWEPGAVRTAGLRSKLRNSVRSRLPLLIHRQIRKKTATCKAKVKKSVAGNATRFSFTDSLGNVAKGYLTFDNGRLYVNIKTKTKAEGAKVHPSVDTVMIKRIKDTKI